MIASSLGGVLLVSCSGSQPESSRTDADPSLPSRSEPTMSEKASPGVSPPAPTKPTTQRSQKAPPVAISPTKGQHSATDKELIAKVHQDVKKKGTIAKQDSGQTYLGEILRSQQAIKLVNGRFTTNLNELAIDNLPDNTRDYRLQVLEANEEKAIVVAIAKQPGIFSYTGAVYAQEASIPLSTICKSNQPSKAPPKQPKLVGSTIVCAPGSTAIE
ncbi:MAG: hypothetical protein HC851_05260 [Acaryochloris sp. RU_4_1]|nr:hypothetical protein [Acaryochloris sp. RU_4_1]NJR53860.1 hypothetical protein [Acaryochloris sp. CRU_2_0]